MDVFVYGTLEAPDRARSVVGEAVEYGPDARLVGLRRVEGRYPTLAPPGDARPTGEDPPTVEGRILRTDRVGALDEYEAVDRGLYVRVTVPVAGERESGDGVEVYVGDPDRLDAAGVAWPGAGEFEDRVRRYVEDGGVTVRLGR